MSKTQRSLYKKITKFINSDFNQLIEQNLNKLREKTVIFIPKNSSIFLNKTKHKFDKKDDIRAYHRKRLIRRKKYHNIEHNGQSKVEQYRYVIKGNYLKVQKLKFLKNTCCKITLKET